MGQELDFDLVQAPALVASFDVNDAEFVVEKFFVVVGIEDLDVGDGVGSAGPRLALRKWINRARLDSEPSLRSWGRWDGSWLRV